MPVKKGARRVMEDLSLSESDRQFLSDMPGEGMQKLREIAHRGIEAERRAMRKAAQAGAERLRGSQAKATRGSAQRKAHAAVQQLLRTRTEITPGAVVSKVLAMTGAKPNYNSVRRYLDGHRELVDEHNRTMRGGK